MPTEKTCRTCGCTDDDCDACVAKMGERCFWIEADLCSACAPPRQFASAIAEMVSGEIAERYPTRGACVLIADADGGLSVGAAIAEGELGAPLLELVRSIHDAIEKTVGVEGDRPPAAPAKAICAHCMKVLGDDDGGAIAREHTLTCEANPLVKEMQRLIAELAVVTVEREQLRHLVKELDGELIAVIDAGEQAARSAT